MGRDKALAAEIENCLVLVACDTAEITEAFLRQLIAATKAIHRKLFKMQGFVSTLRTTHWRGTDSRPLLNVNTLAEWSTR